MQKIAVIGTGYVGLVTGACLADFGNRVICVDQVESKIAALNAGKLPFYEFSLGEIVERNVREGRLLFSSDLAEAIRSSKVIFTAVGTPPGKDGQADLSQVWTVARTIAQHLNGYKVVVQKSTVPVGTGQQVRRIIMESLKKRIPFDVASNPEFLREGSAVEDFMRPNRVVIGTWSKQAEQTLSEIYRPLYLNETPMVKTTVETAELIKYASNAFLATKISFINEMANLCEVVGADVKTVSRAMGLDNRIGSKFLHAGPGYGGSCFPKDTLALASFSREFGTPSRIVEATIEVNEQQRVRMLEKLQTLLKNFKGKEIAVLGLSFKPQTDDVRDSVALDLIRMLQKRGAKVRAFDPVAMEKAAEELKQVKFCDDSYIAAKGADALVIATEWNEFRMLDLNKIKRSMRTPVVLDCRNIYDPAKLESMGFKYSGVGRGRHQEDAKGKSRARKPATRTSAKSAPAPKRAARAPKQAARGPKKAARRAASPNPTRRNFGRQEGGR
ncbi:MAG: UDP-glucose/GDP-mannose dehydrogenase family protein [Candidatus Eisenbacteria bacterium]|nr:UDP-glucose/GDP-mannose dehydrogenase family protein [Candidatus Eisenbacteria bacterium]